MRRPLQGQTQDRAPSPHLRPPRAQEQRQCLHAPSDSQVHGQHLAPRDRRRHRQGQASADHPARLLPRPGSMDGGPLGVGDDRGARRAGTLPAGVCLRAARPRGDRAAPAVPDSRGAGGPASTQGGSCRRHPARHSRSDDRRAGCGERVRAPYYSLHRGAHEPDAALAGGVVAPDEAGPLGGADGHGGGKPSVVW